MLATLIVAGGCAALPRSGPVQLGQAGTGQEIPYPQAVAAPPARDANPAQIVEGFLQAMLAGNTDDFKVARSYLTEEAAAVWNPLVSTTIYQSGEAPSLSEAAPDRMMASFNQVGLVDETGRYSVQTARAEHRTMDLSQDEESQWRIAALPDGIIIPQDVFRGDYVATRIYFPSADGQFLVPDQRVFARGGAATAAVKQFLAGPPPYLSGAVGAVVPPGTRLMTDTVKVSGSVATVNLSNAIARASETARATVLACLKASLMALPVIESVQLQAESVPLEVNSAAGLEVDPKAVEGPFYLGDGGVWRVREGTAELITGTEAAANWESLTVDHSLGRLAGLEAESIAVIEKAGEVAVQWALPEGLGAISAAPVFDRLGWLWVAAGDVIVVFSAEGEPAEVNASGLDGRQITALAPARDGSRLALAVQSADGAAELLVAGVTRGERSAPTRLTDPLAAGRVGASLTSLTWADDVALAFLAVPTGDDEPAPAVLTVGGDVTFLKSPTDPPAAVAAGLGITQIYASGRSGGLFGYSPRGRIWASLASGTRAVVLAP
jgi:hypothetical protein